VTGGGPSRTRWKQRCGGEILTLKIHGGPTRWRGTGAGEILRTKRFLAFNSGKMPGRRKPENPAFEAGHKKRTNSSKKVPALSINSGGAG